MSGERLWQAISAALVVLWVFTTAFFWMRSSLIEGQYLAVIRGDLLSAVQQLAQSQQSLAQRLQALEAAKFPSKGE